MKLLGCALLLAWATTSCSAASQKQSDDSLSSQQILPASFKPPQVFKNTNVMRNINLDKSYVKETVNLVVENVDKRPQSEYYVPFDGTTIGRVGGFTVRDKKDATKPAFRSEVVEYDSNRYVPSFDLTYAS
jgi:oligosaccharyltransferase complex subunit alpha (ribophorin I)